MSHYFENDINLKSNVRELSYKYNSSFFTFLSDNGVFSKKNIDYGNNDCPPRCSIRVRKGDFCCQV